MNPHESTRQYGHWMGLALKEAARALEQGEFPVGCVIVEKGRILATGARQGTGKSLWRPSEIDHAEIRALKNLEALEERFDPGQSVLVCTMEPCLMCFAATLLSGIRTVVFAYEDVMGGGTGCDLSRLPPLYANLDITVSGGVERKKSLDLFKKFFQKEDNSYWKGSLLESYTLSVE